MFVSIFPPKALGLPQFGGFNRLCAIIYGNLGISADWAMNEIVLKLDQRTVRASLQRTNVRSQCLWSERSMVRYIQQTICCSMLTGCLASDLIRELRVTWQAVPGGTPFADRSRYNV
jgi:hypothetical protein